MKNINSNEVIKSMNNNFNSMLNLYKALFASLEETADALTAIECEEEDLAEEFDSMEEFMNDPKAIALANRKLDLRRDHDSLNDTVRNLSASIEALLDAMYWMDENLDSYKVAKHEWEQA